MGPIRPFLPALLWMALIFFLSAQPKLPGPPDPLLDLLLKKTAHLLAYAVLALLWRRAGMRPTVAWLLAALYGVSDELHQAFVPGRHARVLDVGIDALGAGLAVGPSTWPLPRRKP